LVLALNLHNITMITKMLLLITVVSQ